jgi:hypothetical protein
MRIGNGNLKIGKVNSLCGPVILALKIYRKFCCPIRCKGTFAAILKTVHHYDN